MKATGIVRRIDDLGRITIPKEIRQKVHIKEGDPLEIFVDAGAVIFRPYWTTEEVELAKAIKKIWPETYTIYRNKEDTLILQARNCTGVACIWGLGDKFPTLSTCEPVKVEDIIGGEENA